ncbi:methyltransferase domain-containing protein [Brevibacterium casei]|nr:methyltransferase domain-containing protein [Brevibacterium casei]
MSRRPHPGSAGEWEERYAGTEAVWSGEPNPSLVDVVTELDLSPGRGLDVGRGEGADVLWLAARGWQAVGIDVSATAIDRARAAAAAAGTSADFAVADLTDWAGATDARRAANSLAEAASTSSPDASSTPGFPTRARSSSPASANSSPPADTSSSSPMPGSRRGPPATPAVTTGRMTTMPTTTPMLVTTPTTRTTSAVRRRTSPCSRRAEPGTGSSTSARSALVR